MSYSEFLKSSETEIRLSKILRCMSGIELIWFLMLSLTGMKVIVCFKRAKSKIECYSNKIYILAWYVSWLLLTDRKECKL